MLLLLNVSCLFTQQKEIYIGLLKGLRKEKMCILLILCLEERIMSVTIVEGSQWGDEGKGKITDYLAQQSDVVVRFQGGNNAGHTIVFDGRKFAVRSLPSGIFYKNVTNVIADGVVLNPWALKEEIEGIEALGFKDYNLKISSRTQIIMPYHIDLDGAYEELLGNSKIGTTKRGIGPCYTDKAARRGIRVGDLLDASSLKEKLHNTLIIKNLELKSLGLNTYDEEDLFNKLVAIGQFLKPFICDTSYYLNQAIKKKKNILFEGAQGMMLDIDRGTYPYVTSSSPTANYAPQGAGIPPRSITNIVAIAKSYTTRVGAGPFPTELTNEIGDMIREKGHEYGVVTKRPRRVGYLDLVVVKRNVIASGATSIALTLFDVLSEIPEIKICIGYELDGQEIDYIPATLDEYARCKPIYKTFKPFKIEKIGHIGELDEAAQEYIHFIEEYTGVKVSILSIGNDRKDTMILGVI